MSRAGEVDTNRFVTPRVLIHGSLFWRNTESTTHEGSPRAATSSLLGATRSASKPAVSTSDKRPYITDQKDILAVKRIRANEVQLLDRNTVFSGTKDHVRRWRFLTHFLHSHRYFPSTSRLLT